MTKKLAIFLLSIAVTAQLSGCAITDFLNKSEKIARFEPKIARAQSITPAQEVEILNLKTSNSSITFNKSATAEADQKASVSPQTSGKVVKINVKIGDKVSKGTTLLTLGDSLPTDISDIQYQTALEALWLTQDSKIFSDESSKQSMQMAALGIKTAYEALQNAKTSKENAEEIYEEQKQAAKLGKTSAKDAKEFAENSLNKLDNAISAMEGQKETLETTLSTIEPTDSEYEKISETLAKLETALSTAEGQRDTVSFTKENASTGIKQAETGLDSLEAAFEAQSAQLDFAIKMAEIQYEMAEKQFNLAFNGASLQKLGINGQILQMNSAVQIAKLSNDQKYIKSPISGYVTEISAEENNFVAPGQIVVKVGNPKNLLIKTSVNSEEYEFITLNQEVKIISGSKEIMGTITAISPALNELSKKVDIEISAENKAEIKLGSLVKIEIPVKTSHIFVPLNSLYNNSEGKFLKLFEDNKVKFTNVTVGEIVGEYIEIKTGLQGKEKVIITPNTLFEENTAVTIK